MKPRHSWRGFCSASFSVDGKLTSIGKPRTLVRGGRHYFRQREGAAASAKNSVREALPQGSRGTPWLSLLPYQIRRARADVCEEAYKQNKVDYGPCFGDLVAYHAVNVKHHRPHGVRDEKH